MEQDNKKILRQLVGTVTSSKMDKTAVVKVDRQVTNRKYQKKYTLSKKYKCHDAKNEYKEGDLVVFAACRPISKDKRWRILRKLK